MAGNYCVFGRKRKKNENDKYIFGRKRKWPKPSKIAIFGAENENEFQSVSIPQLIRDVTKFEFDNVGTSKFSTDSKFDECFKRFVVQCKFVEESLFHN